MQLPGELWLDIVIQCEFTSECNWCGFYGLTATDSLVSNTKPQTHKGLVGKTTAASYNYHNT